MATTVPEPATKLVLAMVGISQTFQIEDYTLPAGEVDMIPTTHQRTIVTHPKGGMTFKPADYQDNGAFAFACQHDQDYDHYDDLGTEGAVTITTRSGATVAFDGVFQSYTPQASTLNEKMMADVVIKVSGDVTVTGA